MIRSWMSGCDGGVAMDGNSEIVRFEEGEKGERVGSAKAGAATTAQVNGGDMIVKKDRCEREKKMKMKNRKKIIFSPKRAGIHHDSYRKGQKVKK